MQQANANAPKILEAMTLLGTADPSHVAFALCGLPFELRRGADSAVAALRPVAARLTSRKIACSLRIETAERLAASSQREMSPADWSAPPTDVLEEIIEQSASLHSQLRGPHQGFPVANLRWLLASKLAQVSRCWTESVRGWRHDVSSIYMWQCDDVALRVVARDAPALERLQIKDARHDRLLLRDGTLATLAAGCPRLTELQLPDAVLPQGGGGLLRMVAALPNLERLEVIGMRCAAIGVAADASRGADAEARWAARLCVALLQQSARLTLLVNACDAAIRGGGHVSRGGGADGTNAEYGAAQGSAAAEGHATRHATCHATAEGNAAGLTSALTEAVLLAAPEAADGEADGGGASERLESMIDRIRIGSCGCEYCEQQNTLE